MIFLENRNENQRQFEAIYHKITTGFVTQTFGIDEDGKFSCTEQSFTAGDEVDRENEFGDPIEIDTTKENYQPFEMVQPNTEIVVMVSGGLVQGVKIPAGMNDVTVVVKDYDTDGVDEAQEDEDGLYLESRWTA